MEPSLHLSLPTFLRWRRDAVLDGGFSAYFAADSGRRGARYCTQQWTGARLLLSPHTWGPALRRWRRDAVRDGGLSASFAADFRRRWRNGAVLDWVLSALLATTLGARPEVVAERRCTGRGLVCIFCRRIGAWLRGRLRTLLRAASQTS